MAKACAHNNPHPSPSLDLIGVYMSLRRTLFQVVRTFFRHDRHDAQVLPDTKVAQTLAGILASMFSLFAGFLISPSKVPDFWLWAYYLSPLHYVVEVRPRRTCGHTFNLVVIGAALELYQRLRVAFWPVEPNEKPSSLCCCRLHRMCYCPERCRLLV